MKRALVITLVFATSAAACGGSGSHGSNGSHTTSSTESAATSSSGSSTTSGTHLNDCIAAGIDPTQMREGTCTHGGTTWVIVDEDHTLRLKSLWATLRGIRAVKVLASATGTTPATGRFVVATVTITNKVPAPQSLDAAGTQQAELNLDGAVFKEAVGAEHSADANSCLARQGSRVQAGKSETCELVFDVPSPAAAKLGKHGSGDLYLVDFGSDLSGSILPRTIGQIRLYR